MKILISALAFLNGGFMLFDGIYVMLKGKYIGSEKPGPWARLFYMFDINVFKLGPLFIAFGLLWLTWIYVLWNKRYWAYAFGLLISIFTLWYLPVGTIFSIIVLTVLITARAKIDL